MSIKHHTTAFIWFGRLMAVLAFALAVAIVWAESARAQETPAAFFAADRARLAQQAVPAASERRRAGKRPPIRQRAQRVQAEIAFGVNAGVRVGRYGVGGHVGASVSRRGLKVNAGVRPGGVSPRLLSFASEFGLRITSGYRPGARVAGTRRLSNHARGTAIDAVGGNMRGAIAAARARGMGVGTYSPCTRHRHVHFSLSASERYHMGCGKRSNRHGRH